MNIVLIAHDSKKKLMQNLCIAYRSILVKHEIFATETTGRLVEDASGLNVHKVHAGHLGGVEQLMSRIDSNEMDMVIFLHDPEIPRSHDNAYYNIFISCDNHNIPIATNLATAELIIKALERGDLDWRNLYKH
jgi:methylglyoxal synthase